jgi:hypothetical protein
MTVVAPLVHTLGYLVTTVVLSSVVYERIGVRVLRRAWINFDLIWGVAMVGAAVFALVLESDNCKCEYRVLSTSTRYPVDAPGMRVSHSPGDGYSRVRPELSGS